MCHYLQCLAGREWTWKTVALQGSHLPGVSPLTKATFYATSNDGAQVPVSERELRNASLIRLGRLPAFAKYLGHCVVGDRLGLVLESLTKVEWWEGNDVGRVFGA